MGRAPCCDKTKVKKGPWSPEEDAKLKAYIDQRGTGGNWIALPQKIGLKRCGKSCRLRWLNYLRPNIKHGGFSEEEDNIICSLYISIGSRWSIIAAQLPGRTDNDIKNYWNTKLKKKLFGKHSKEQQASRVSYLKQETKKGNQNFMVANSENQILYRPAPPVPYSNQGPRVSDGASIRELPIKLGGGFSDYHRLEINDNANLRFPVDISSTEQQFYEDTSMLSSHPSSMNSLNRNLSQFLSPQYDMDGAGMHMTQGLNRFLFEVDEMVYRNPQDLDGIECFFGVDMVNGSTTAGTNSAESSSLDDNSSLPYPSIASSYEVFQQEMTPECAFQDGGLRQLGSL